MRVGCLDLVFVGCWLSCLRVGLGCLVWIFEFPVVVCFVTTVLGMIVGLCAMVEGGVLV